MGLAKMERFGNLAPGKEYDAQMTVTSVETQDIQTGAYFCEPTEKTKQVHERLIAMCMDDINASQRRHAAKNDQITLVDASESATKTKKKKKYRKRTEAEKKEKREKSK